MAIWRDLVWQAKRKWAISYARITLTRSTALFFLLALAHFIAQLTLQSLNLSDNVMGAAVTDRILRLGSVPAGMPVFVNHQLFACDGAPKTIGTTCTFVSEGRDRPFRHAPRSFGYLDHLVDFHSLGAWARSESVPDSVRPDTTRHDTRSFGYLDHLVDFHSLGTWAHPESVPDSARPLVTRHHMKVSEDNDGDLVVDGAQISDGCIQAMIYPDDFFKDSKREDVVTLLFQLWLFALSFVAIVNESVPHLVAALVCHTLDTAWAGFRVSGTLRFKQLFTEYVANGACGGLDVLEFWWSMRLTRSIIILVLNGITLAGIAPLTVLLYRAFQANSFERVSVNAHITRLYKIMLAFSVCLQLAWFFGISAAGALANKLLKTDLAHSTTSLLVPVFLIIFAQTPWFYLGWIFPRVECRWRCFTFFVFSALFISTWVALFTMPLFRFLFGIFQFYATLAITAIVFTTFAIVLGTVCRLNFDRGLGHYLLVRNVLEQADFTPERFSSDAMPKGHQKDSLSYLDRLGLKAAEEMDPLPDMLHIARQPAIVQLPLPAYAAAEPRPSFTRVPSLSAPPPRKPSTSRMHGSLPRGSGESTAYRFPPPRPVLASRFSVASDGTFGSGPMPI